MAEITCLFGQIALLEIVREFVDLFFYVDILKH